MNKFRWYCKDLPLIECFFLRIVQCVVLQVTLDAFFEESYDVVVI